MTCGCANAQDSHILYQHFQTFIQLTKWMFWWWLYALMKTWKFCMWFMLSAITVSGHGSSFVCWERQNHFPYAYGVEYKMVINVRKILIHKAKYQSVRSIIHVPALEFCDPSSNIHMSIHCCVVHSHVDHGCHVYLLFVPPLVNLQIVNGKYTVII